eukprot:UN24269
MTTVGYGDSYPIEDLGQLLAVMTMFLGLFVIALPVIIVGGNFDRVYSDYRKEKERELRMEENMENAAGQKNRFRFKHIFSPKKKNAYQRMPKSHIPLEHFLDKINRQIHVACGGQDVFYNFLHRMICLPLWTKVLIQ